MKAHTHFYVSAVEDRASGKRFLVAGPYGSRDEAKSMVDHVRRHAEREQPDKAHWMYWGTAGSVGPIKTPLGEGWKPVAPA